MNWKKDLTIQTKFFEDSIDGIPDAILVPPNHEFIRIETGPSEDQDVRNAAEIIQRLLSNKLIENFLNCWEILKQTTLPAGVYRSHHLTSNSSLLSQIRKEEDRYRLRHYTDKVVDTEEIHSSNVGWLQEQREDLCRKTKIAYTHIQRAKLLKQIVQKLKRARSQAHMVSDNIVRVRSNHRLMSQIRHLEQVANQLHIQRLASMKAPPQYVLQQRQQNGVGESRRHQIIKEDEQLQQRLWMQMQLLREELQGLRIENQNILSNHLTRQDQIEHLRKEKQLLFQRYQTLQHQHELLRLQSLSKHESQNIKNTQITAPSQQALPNHPLYNPQTQSSRQYDQFKRQYEKEMAVLHQRIRQMQKRQDLIQNQLLSEIKIREEHIKQNERKQRNEAQKIRSNKQAKQKTKEQDAKRQQFLREQLEKQLRLKEKLIRDYAQQQQLLRQQIQRQQLLRQQAKREQNQREIEAREQNLREFQQKENRLREELIKEYQNREAAIKLQQQQLNFRTQQPLQYAPVDKISSSNHHYQRLKETNFDYGTEKADRNRSIPRQLDQTKGFGYTTTKTIKTVSQNPVIVWHETSKQEMTTKNQYHLSSIAREGDSIHSYLQGTKKLEWPKVQQRTEFCGCCF